MVIISPETGSRLAVLAAIVVSATAASAQQTDVELGRRVADVAAIAVAEYSEGVVDGRVVQLEELNEAQLFLDGARRTSQQPSPEVGAEVIPRLDRMASLIEALSDIALVRDELLGLRSVLEELLEVPLDPLPDIAPSLTMGAELYEENCTQCHGSRGAADGELAGTMNPPPANLTDREALRSVPPVEFFRKINVGVAGTAMPGFSEQLTLPERWSLALFAATLRHSGDERGTGLLLLGECPACRLVASDLSATAWV